MEKTSSILKLMCYALLGFFVIYEAVLIVYLFKDYIDFYYYYLCTMIYVIIFFTFFGFYKVYRFLERLEAKVEQNKKD
ncbi:MAG: hypothetical protein IJW36_01645 [Clostridia bacterium]|nr:hypothetical protein [Clostridia bacterium]